MRSKKGTDANWFKAPETRIWLILAILAFSQATWGLEKGLVASTIFLICDYLLVKTPFKQRRHSRLRARIVALFLAFLLPVLFILAEADWQSYQCGKSDSCQFLIKDKSS
ncbi:MAG: hypothetical protein AAGE37_10890 [Pseudomonadota bacterium]